VNGQWDLQQPPKMSRKRRVLTFIAIVVGILVVSVVLDVLLHHQAAPHG
jgi:hypothetical protein